MKTEKIGQWAATLLAAGFMVFALLKNSPTQLAGSDILLLLPAGILAGFVVYKLTSPPKNSQPLNAEDLRRLSDREDLVQAVLSKAISSATYGYRSTSVRVPVERFDEVSVELEKRGFTVKNQYASDSCTMKFDITW